MSARRVLVVGAGVSGLAAAVRLRDAGCEVRVLDPGPPGGTARTAEPRPGWVVEWGPHSLTHRADAVFALAERAGVADRLVRFGAAASRRYVVRGGRLNALGPFGRAFTPAERWEVLRGLFRAAPPAPDETIDAWMRRQFGPAFADGVGSVLTVGIWATSPAQVAFDAGFPALAERLRGAGRLYRAAAGGPKPSRRPGTYGFPGGMGTLTGALVRALGQGTLRPERVESVEIGPDGVGAGREAADAVVVAGQAHDAARLLGDLDPALRALAEVRYGPLVVAHWLAADAALPAGFGWLALPAERRPLLGTIFASDICPGRAPEGLRSFASMLGGTFEPDAVGLDTEAVRRRVEEEHRALTGKPVKLEAIEVIRHVRAVAIPGPGHRARVAAALAATPARVALAGSWLGTGAMDDGVKAGFAAADRVLATLGVGRGT